MPDKFKVTIATELGSITDNSFSANSVQQISDRLPDGARLVEAIFVKTILGNSVADEEVFLDLLSMVGNIEEGVTYESLLRSTI